MHNSVRKMHTFFCLWIYVTSCKTSSIKDTQSRNCLTRLQTEAIKRLTCIIGTGSVGLFALSAKGTFIV